MVPKIRSVSPSPSRSPETNIGRPATGTGALMFDAAFSLTSIQPSPTLRQMRNCMFGGGGRWFDMWFPGPAFNLKMPFAVTKREVSSQAIIAKEEIRIAILIHVTNGNAARPLESFLSKTHLVSDISKSSVAHVAPE